MTVGRGAAWGEQVSRPERLRVVADDRELAAALTDGSDLPTTVQSGDMLRTLGGHRPPSAQDDGRGSRHMLAAPIDLIAVRLDGAPPEHAVAHVLVRSPRRRGGFARGPVVLVMNAEFMGAWDVAPRGHPNDGRVEVVSCAATMGLRQRLEARRRLTSAGHLPHPEITSRSLAAATLTFDRPMTVVADGHHLRTARIVDLLVLPDAATLHF